MVEGKNELERFTDKFGYNAISAIMEKEIGNYASDLDLDVAYSFYDMDMVHTRNLTISGTCFEYYAVYNVTVSYIDERREENTKSKWFTFHCTAEVDDILKSFEVVSYAPYSRLPNSGNATENFVPVIHKKHMDGLASEFLRKHYPKALLEPVAVPIREIAKNMGLKMQFGFALSEDFSYFGQISFSNMKTKVYDVVTGAGQDLDVSRGTILIDPAVLWERSQGSENFTIAHEVVHWEKHKLFADIKRLLYRNYNYTARRCPKPDAIAWEPGDKWSEQDFIEWHANGIAARILMPKETLTRKINEISVRLKETLKPASAEFFIALIDELAVFYGTSRQTTKYQLRDIGHDQVDEIQIHEYDYQAYTHEIDEYKAFYELCDNADLRMVVQTGFFTYADNHFAINHERCVTIGDDGIPHLTDFAWANITKCTLKFRNVRINVRENRSRFSDILYSSSTLEIFQKFRNEDNKSAYEFANELAAEFKAQAQERDLIRVTFTDRAQQIMSAKGVDSNDFQALTLLSRNMFSLFKKRDYQPSFRTIIAFCAGMDLDIHTTSDLLSKAGYTFGSSDEHSAYMTAISNFRGKSILVRNEFLRKLSIKGVEPLGEKNSE